VASDCHGCCCQIPEPDSRRRPVGAEADCAKIEQLLSELSGKDLAEVIAAGSSKLASVPSGGGGGGGSAPAAAAGGAAPAKEEKKKEEEKEEPEEVRAASRRPGCSGLGF
jgi:ribosomal protein L12E/L44/L45/RPP1/RPP2